ncbi:alpha/beta hydrolase [Leucobacter sp. CSA2]|uniref:Alpha/beta hydrolase n=1 Tax=Leucobacter edaphi TaxID=2796472 RepID=A0A934QCL9_9MICO|nr:alpha/beta hydrolase [Leucobacter edaphi]MBK0420807.1 alpha/beta hydrolase [Leucobacter edaphi]
MPRQIPLTDRLARTVMRLLSSLPVGAQRRIGGKPIQIDGQTLAPEIQMGLRLLALVPGSEFTRLPLEKARRQVDSEAAVFGGDVPVATVADFELPTRSGRVAARRYANVPQQETTGTVVYFHGGGWVVGGLESTDSACRFLAKHSTLEVISVAYRLAPEHPFPAGLEDAIDAYRWARKVRPGVPVAVAGDSAGGNLSAAVCLATIDDPIGTPDFQLLYCPCTDLSTKAPSYELFGEGFFLTEEQMDWYKAHYLRTPEAALDPLASPLLADAGTFAKLPPAHVAVSGFDVLRDEGIAYAERLREAGVPVTLQIVESAIHAFINITGVSRMSARAFQDSIDSLERGLSGRDRAISD